MTLAHYPSLYQINTRVWLTEIARRLGRPATLDDVPDAELDRLTAMGFDFLWLMSVWQTDAAGLRISRTNPAWRKEFEETLPNLTDDDIGGSGFAITSYTVHSSLCGDAALARLRERMRKRGLRLVLDFVPNHTAIDHPWVEKHPDYYIQCTEAEFARAPQNYIRVNRKDGDLRLALGRDPFFPAWPDVLQLNYGNPALQEAMIGQLTKIAGQCDGVRCDMAMLILPEIFEQTWGIRAEPFWPKAIKRIRREYPDFRFMAEVYWDLEWTLQQQGFDYTYDKRLYDRLRAGYARPVREHLLAGLDYQNKLVRFMENHDEPRAATAFSPEMHKAAAVVTYLAPGLRFFQQGQFGGRKVRVSPHLIRAPNEPLDAAIQAFYDRLLPILRQPVLRDGRWQLLECTPAWEDNWTNDCFIAFAWQNNASERLLATVNYAPNQSQCFVRFPFGDLAGRPWRLRDQLSEAAFDRDGGDIHSRGLYLDLAPWHFHAFSIKPIDDA
jgi:glycosidase